jgi:predicted enzyme related to lactoylglutathione lyase
VTTMFLGLRTVIYPTSDLAASKAWYSAVLGIEPYFDQPFYVGYNVNGYELGLLPDADPGAITYWGIADIDVALARLHDHGATPRSGPDDVGDDIRVATVTDPAGAIVGIIENPHFQIPATAQPSSGPGR